ncbi:hypothetical protein [Paenibacillus planticolens]|uniref:DUF8042 domain-containing protein n=1 Tax=Paenibacillus planticolens TaxID=2654976 RepID=A0ABX1ZN75_9BACL|nr:hypothetical protein [Paenibacillus planticolens]NOV00470.1 hypothetical protein [Paenibacillus planticolens]
MKLTINDEIWNFENNDLSYTNLFTLIENLAESKSLVFSHILVDGQLFEEIDEEIWIKVSKDMNEVQVIMKPEAEITKDVLLAIQSYLKRAKDELRILAKQFHQGPKSETWVQFSLLMEGLEWLMTAFQKLSYLNKNSQIETYQVINTLSKIISELGEALEVKDFGLIGDLIEYELETLFEKYISEYNEN